MNFKTYADLINDIKKNLFLIKSKDFDLVVGIPRSGMVPAYMISLELNIDCTSLPSFLKNVELTRGKTRNSRYNLSYAWDASKILLVDDSIASGGSLQSSMEKIPPELKSKITTLAIYSSIKKRTDVDFYFSYVPNQRIFEWNIFHHPGLSLSCLDIDDLLIDLPKGFYSYNDEQQGNYFKSVIPNIFPSLKLHTLITNLGEKHKIHLEDFLQRNKILYHQIIFLDKVAGSYYDKAKYYKNNKLILFLTKDSIQSQNICNISAKPVYSLMDNKIYNPALITSLCEDPYFLPKKLKQYFRGVIEIKLHF